MTKKGYSSIQINNIISIEGYEAGKGRNKHVAMVEDLVIFKSLNSKKTNQGVRSLIVSVRVSDPEFIIKYGKEIIVVSKKFTKLPKKQKLALLEIENQQFYEADQRFISNLGEDVASTSKDREISAHLVASEKYGFRHVRKALKKQQRVMLKSEAPLAKGLYKNYKKSNKKNEKVEAEELAIPINLQNA